MVKDIKLFRSRSGDHRPEADRNNLDTMKTIFVRVRARGMGRVVSIENSFKSHVAQRAGGFVYIYIYIYIYIYGPPLLPPTSYTRCSSPVARRSSPVVGTK